MKITIGTATEESMKRLGIKSYPFTSRELSIAFRTKLKEVHPDMNNEGEKKHNEETRQVIGAYKHLKNLVIDPEETEKVEQEIEEDIDIFALYKTCPSCFGRRTKVVVTGGYSCPTCGGVSLFNLWAFRIPKGYTFKICGLCNGHLVIGKYNKPCPACNGSGRVKIRCLHCKGTGYVQEKVEHRPCSNCHGKGKVELNPWNPVIPKGAVLKGIFNKSDGKNH